MFSIEDAANAAADKASNAQNSLSDFKASLPDPTSSIGSGLTIPTVPDISGKLGSLSSNLNSGISTGAGGVSSSGLLGVSNSLLSNAGSATGAVTSGLSSLTSKWDSATKGVDSLSSLGSGIKMPALPTLPSIGSLGIDPSKALGNLPSLLNTKEGAALAAKGITTSSVGETKVTSLLLDSNKTREASMGVAAVDMTPGGGISSTQTSDVISSSANTGNIGFKVQAFSTGYNGLAVPTYFCGPNEKDAVVDIYNISKTSPVNSFQSKAPDVVKGAQEAPKDTAAKDMYSLATNATGPGLKPPATAKGILSNITDSIPGIKSSLSGLSTSALGKIGLNSKTFGSVTGSIGGNMGAMLKGDFGSLSSITSAVNSLSSGKFPSNLTNMSSISGMVSSLVNLGGASGISGILPALQRNLKGNILSSALDDILPSVVSGKNTNTLKDLAMSSVSGNAKQKMPDIALGFLSNTWNSKKEVPATTKSIYLLTTPGQTPSTVPGLKPYNPESPETTVDKATEFGNVSYSLSAIDPQWNVASRGTDTVTNATALLNDSTVYSSVIIPQTSGDNIYSITNLSTGVNTPIINPIVEQPGNGFKFTTPIDNASVKTYSDAVIANPTVTTTVTLSSTQEMAATVASVVKAHNKPASLASTNSPSIYSISDTNLTLDKKSAIMNNDDSTAGLDTPAPAPTVPSNNVDVNGYIKSYDPALINPKYANEPAYGTSLGIFHRNSLMNEIRTTNTQGPYKDGRPTLLQDIAVINRVKGEYFSITENVITDKATYLSKYYLDNDSTFVSSFI